MRLTRIVAGASLALVALPSLSAQQRNVEADKLEQELRKIDRAEAAAVLASDVPAMEKLWADDFTVNAPSNRILKGKQDAIKAVKDGFLDYSSFEPDVEAVLVHEDTVILMGQETVKPKTHCASARGGITTSIRSWSVQVGCNAERRLPNPLTAGPHSVDVVGSHSDHNGPRFERRPEDGARV